jgi:hypothetical protein
MIYEIVDNQKELDEVIDTFNASELSSSFKIEPLNIHNNSVVIVAKNNESIKGSIAGSFDGSQWYIRFLWAKHAIYALRLLKKIEEFFKRNNVKYYVFPIQKENKRWLSTIKKISIYYFEDENFLWFFRSINNVGLRNIRNAA